MSAVACCSVMPAFILPIAVSPGCAPRGGNVGTAGPSGSQTSVSLDGKRMAAGMMPITVCGWPLSVIARPTRPASAPKRLRQSRSLTTATRAVPARSSAAPKTRPASGGTPVAPNASADASAAIKRSGWSVPVKVVLVGRYTPRCSNT